MEREEEAIKPAAVQLAETSQPHVTRLQSHSLFRGPTAEELDRLIHVIPKNVISDQQNERDNCFAGLLNRGSSLE